MVRIAGVKAWNAVNDNIKNTRSMSAFMDLLKISVVESYKDYFFHQLFLFFTIYIYI